MVPLCLVFAHFCRFFRSSSRELKRLEGVTRSPVFVLFNETLQGLPTIRAFRLARRYARKACELVDTNSGFHFTFYFTGRWLQIRQDMV